jgi:BT1 family
MGQIAFMPVLVLAARLCPPGVEATLFALLMSVMNFAGFVSYELGAVLTHWLGVTETNFDKLWLLVLITNVSTLFPLPLLGWLPGADEITSEGEPIVALELDSGAAKHMSQPILPDLVSEMILAEAKESQPKEVQKS